MQSRYTVQSWRADGLSLCARDYSPLAEVKKLPVVCLHGLTRNSKDFDRLAGWLIARGHRVVAPDIRGRGRSGYDLDPMRYVPATYAEDIAVLLETLGMDKAIFIGTSLGGIITMMLMARRPSMVAAAVLNDVGPEVSPAGLTRIASYAGKPAIIESWADAREYVRRINETAFPLFGDDEWMAFARLTFRDDEEGKPRFDYDPAIAEPIKAGRLKTDPAMLWPLFEKLCHDRPVMLVRGLLSDIVSDEIVERMKARAPSLEVAGIPDVGHAPLLDEPLSLDALSSFLERMEGIS